MNLPSQQEYLQSFWGQLREVALRGLQERYRGAKFALKTDGQPLSWNGQHSICFQADVAGRRWAYKCPTGHWSEANDKRFRIIQEILKPLHETPGLPLMAFEYEPAALQILDRTGGWRKAPLMLLAWADGEAVHEFVRKHLATAPDNIVKAARSLCVLQDWLEKHGLAHGDISNSNLRLTLKGDKVEATLIDYDALWHERLSGLPSGERGTRNFTHPGRDASHAGPLVDRFSFCLMALSLLAIGHAPAYIGQRTPGFKPDEHRLLFSSEDLAHRSSSGVAQALMAHPTEEVRRLAGRFLKLLEKGPLDAPRLDDFLSETPVPKAAEPPRTKPKADGARRAKDGSRAPGATAKVGPEAPSNERWLRLPSPAEYRRTFDGDVCAVAIAGLNEPFRAAVFKRNGAGRVVSWSGQHSICFQGSAGGATWAFKCPTGRWSNEDDARYNRLAEVLAPICSVDSPLRTFRFEPDRLQVYRNEGMAKAPLMVIAWAEGLPVHEFVTLHLAQAPELVLACVDALARLQQWLETHGLAHGDISNTNLRLSRKNDGTVNVVVIDYDGVWHAALDGFKRGELGTKNFNHPAREASHTGPAMDRFSFCLMALSLLALGHDPGWVGRHRPGFAPDESRLLFTLEDLRSPATSWVFQALRTHRNADVVRLTEELLGFLTESPLEAPTLATFLAQGRKSTKPRAIPPAVARPSSQPQAAVKPAAVVSGKAVVNPPPIPAASPPATSVVRRAAKPAAIPPALPSAGPRGGEAVRPNTIPSASAARMAPSNAAPAAARTKQNAPGRDMQAPTPAVDVPQTRQAPPLVQVASTTVKQPKSAGARRALLYLLLLATAGLAALIGSSLGNNDNGLVATERLRAQAAPEPAKPSVAAQAPPTVADTSVAVHHGKDADENALMPPEIRDEAPAVGGVPVVVPTPETLTDMRGSQQQCETIAVFISTRMREELEQSSLEHRGQYLTYLEILAAWNGLSNPPGATGSIHRKFLDACTRKTEPMQSPCMNKALAGSNMLRCFLAPDSGENRSTWPGLGGLLPRGAGPSQRSDIVAGILADNSWSCSDRARIANGIFSHDLELATYFREDLTRAAANVADPGNTPRNEVLRFKALELMQGNLRTCGATLFADVKQPTDESQSPEPTDAAHAGRSVNIIADSADDTEPEATDAAPGGENPELLTMRGAALSRLPTRSKDAEKLFREALKFDRNFHAARYHLARELVLQQKFQESLQELQILRKQGTVGALSELSKALTEPAFDPMRQMRGFDDAVRGGPVAEPEKAKPENANDWLARKLAETPYPQSGSRNYATDLNEAGFVARKRSRDNATAMLYYQKAVNADPSYEYARYNLACELALAGRHDEALGHLLALRRINSSLAAKLLRSAPRDSDFRKLRGNRQFKAVTSE